MSRLPWTRWSALACAVLLAGCASPDPDGSTTEVTALVRGKTAGVDATMARAPTEATREAIAALLVPPLSAEAAVRIALLNNPSLQASLAALDISDADRVQAGRVPNPHFAIGRFTEGSKVEIERFLKFDVLGLLTLPWRARWAGQQSELARLQAAQDVVRTAADTRKAWIRAVAAGQTAQYMRDVKEAAEAGAALQNPLPHTPDVIAHGKFVWDNVCITCHGPKGAGDGTLTQLFPKPPSLMTQKVRDWPDGEIFHRPMRGQGSMPSHARQVDARDIWSVVHYIRQMQSEQPVAPPAAAAQPAATGAAAEPAAGKTTGGMS